jgi:hypothetical protein
LYLNARLGVSARYYRDAAEDIPVIITADGGIEGELHPFKFLALQFGLNYAMDWDPKTSAPLKGSSILSTPVMLKFIFNPGTASTLGFYGGGYMSFAHWGPTSPPPFGVLGGLDVAVSAGPGAVLFDLRYSKDLGSTGIQDGEFTAYNRMFLTFSIGYKFGFINRKGRR